MSRLAHQPARASTKLSTGRGAFLLFTGPCAWLVQLCIGDSLLSWPCFPLDVRRDAPLVGYEATWSIALILLLICALLAFIAGLASWRTLRDVQKEGDGGHPQLVPVGQGRTRFVALWGVVLGFGFTAATLVTLAGFALVPRCAG
jgi:hypothetical protein